MSKESKEIREIMNDIKQIITESYAFGGQSDEEFIPEEGDNFNSELDDNLPTNNIHNGGNKSETKNIDAEVKEMRKIALSVISNLTPMEDQEAYKLVKSIWDSCDKFLTKDTKEVKPQIQNNNN